MKSRLECLLLLSALVIPNASIAQIEKSDKLKPRWMHDNIERSNSSFVYDKIPSTGVSLKEARDNSLSNLIVEVGLEGGQLVKANVESYTNEQHILNNGKKEKSAQETIKVEASLEGKPVTLTAKTIDEYWERDKGGTYHLHTLYARSQVNVTPKFDNIKLTTNYGVSGLWRSALVPGWGQLFKGSTLKGALIMSGTVACIGGIIITECTRASYTPKIDKTHDVNLKKIYANRRSNYATGRNICIGALCAVYVYNIVDAIVAPGARQILTSPADSKIGYSWTPILTDDLGIGIHTSFTF